MSVDKKQKEAAGAKVPATPSKVEGVETTNDQGQLDLAAVDQQTENASASLSDKELEALKAEVAAKDAEIESLKVEHQKFKDDLKPKVESLMKENEDLKNELQTLKAAPKAGVKGAKSDKSAAKYVVANSFRGNKEGEGIFSIGDDVSHFEAERLNILVERELVKKV